MKRDTTSQVHQHDLGLAEDLPKMIDRRHLLALGAGAAAWLAGPAMAEGDRAPGLCTPHPQETRGPFPADGTNGRFDVLSESGVIRGDLRPSFAGFEGRAEGVDLTLELTLMDAQGCTPLTGYALYLWHCDAGGHYSLCEMPEVNYLRGMGIADDAGLVRFTTVFPGCYPGRWPHFHYQLFSSANEAGNAALVSQLALPEHACRAVYEDPRYSGSLDALDRLSLETDGIFRDNSAAERAAQTLSIAGDPATGLFARGAITASS